MTTDTKMENPDNQLRPPNQNKRLGLSFKIAAYVVGGAGFVYFAANDGGTSRMTLMTSLIAIVAFIVAFVLYERGKRHLAPNAAEMAAADGRAPILYLRSFDADETASFDEQALARILEEAGPFLAIGRPGDKLPPLGAARFYVDDKHWQNSVAKLLDRAALVVLLAGKTDGLFWELRQCRQRLAPSQLVILLPTDRSAYDQFRDSQRKAGLKIKLPDYPEQKPARFKAGQLGAILHFSEDWRGHITLFEKATFKGASHEFASSDTRKEERLRLALQPVAARAGLAIQKPRTNFVAILSWSYGALIIMVLVVLGILIAMGVLE